MGYRSDVTIMMYPKNEKDFAALKLYVDENLPDQFEVREGEIGHKYLLLEFSGIKWYEEYEDDVYTRAFSEWEQVFADPNRDPTRSEHAPIFHYEFMRVGEEYEDVVYDCSYGSDHALNISREIYIDF